MSIRLHVKKIAIKLIVFSSLQVSIAESPLGCATAFAVKVEWLVRPPLIVLVRSDILERFPSLGRAGGISPQGPSPFYLCEFFKRGQVCTRRAAAALVTKGKKTGAVTKGKKTSAVTKGKKTGKDLSFSFSSCALSRASAVCVSFPLFALTHFILASALEHLFLLAWPSLAPRLLRRLFSRVSSFFFVASSSHSFSFFVDLCFSIRPPWLPLRSHTPHTPFILPPPSIPHGLLPSSFLPSFYPWLLPSFLPPPLHP